MKKKMKQQEQKERVTQKKGLKEKKKEGTLKEITKVKNKEKKM